jgi:hypothetical protein
MTTWAAIDPDPTLAVGSRDFKLADPDFTTLAAVSYEIPQAALVAATQLGDDIEDGSVPLNPVRRPRGS